MKKLIMIILVCISLSTSAQKTDSIPKPISDTADCVLPGKLIAFKLLYKALTTPGDITFNQMKALIEWVDKQTVILTDKKPKK